MTSVGGERIVARVLREIKNVRQEAGAGRRRWFESDNFELVIWLDPEDEVTGFQICYDFGKGEHALTWRPDDGFVHSKVDAGEGSPVKNQTPILVPAGRPPGAELARIFDARSNTLEPRLREFVRARLTPTRRT